MSKQNNHQENFFKATGSREKNFKLLSEVEQKKKYREKLSFFIQKPFKTPFSFGIFQIFLPLLVIITFLIMIFYGRGEEYQLFLISPFLLLPVNIIEFLFKIKSFFLAFLIISFLFALTPAVIVLFQYHITKSWQICFFSSLMFCFIVWYCLLINKIESPRLLLQFAEGEHLAALPVLLIASLLFWEFLKKGTVKRLLAASVSIGFLTLFSKSAFLAFLVFLAIFSLSEIFLRSTKTTIKRVILSFVCAGGLMAFWYNPHFMINVLKASFEFELWGKLWQLFPLVVWLTPITGAILFLLFNQVPARQPLFINLGLFVIPGLTLVSWYAVDFFIWPLPGRFVWEFLLGASLFGGFLLEILSVKLGDYLKQRFNFEKWQLMILVNLARLVFITLWVLIIASLFSNFYEVSILEFKNWHWRREKVSSFVRLKYWKQMFSGFLITLLTIWLIYKNREKVIV